MTPNSEPAVTQSDRLDLSAERAAFEVWWRIWCPHRDVPSFTSHIFDAWLASARHRHASEDRERVLREALQTALNILVQHHQWHAAQTEPIPEHGFIPADEYSDSSLCDRTVDALEKASRALNPVRDFQARTSETPND